MVIAIDKLGKIAPLNPLKPELEPKVTAPPVAKVNVPLPVSVPNTLNVFEPISPTATVGLLPRGSVHVDPTVTVLLEAVLLITTRLNVELLQFIT